jgi:hypothetical protein
MLQVDLDLLLEYAKCGETPTRAAAIQAAVAELRQLRGQTCETCKHNDHGDCQRSAIRCEQGDPYFDDETLYRSCETFGNGCRAHEPKA